jgi:hypothetical protein
MSSSTLYTRATGALLGAALREVAMWSVGGDDGEFGEFDPDDWSFLSVKEFVPFTVADIAVTGDDR